MSKSGAQGHQQVAVAEAVEQHRLAHGRGEQAHGDVLGFQALRVLRQVDAVEADRPRGLPELSVCGSSARA